MKEIKTESNGLEKTIFRHWTPEKSEKLLVFVEELCEDPMDASAHLASCLVALCPKIEYALDLCKFVESQIPEETA
jgi:hypothetical protein|tara:strand:- start:352 stop:579 length:228 start_codon:yes stop_codon:yes gene_type:complete